MIKEGSLFYEFFLIPKTPKGIETFKICHLYRMELPLNKAKRKDLQGEPFRIQVIEKLLSDPSASPKIIDQCVKIGKEIVRRGKNRMAIFAAKRP